MDKFNPILGLVARIFLGLIFVMGGVGKIQGFEGFQGYMESGGIPGVLAPAVIAFEILAGAAVIIGFQARLAALALAGFSILAALMYHFDFGNQMQVTMFMKNLAIAGGMLMVFIHGSGQYSLQKQS